MHRRFAADTRRSLFGNPCSTSENHEALLVPWVVAGAVVGASTSEKFRSTWSVYRKGLNLERSRSRVEDVGMALTFTPQNRCTPFLALLDILEGITTWGAHLGSSKHAKMQKKIWSTKHIAKAPTLS